MPKLSKEYAKFKETFLVSLQEKKQRVERISTSTDYDEAIKEYFPGLRDKLNSDSTYLNLLDKAREGKEKIDLLFARLETLEELLEVQTIDSLEVFTKFKQSQEEELSAIDTELNELDFSDPMFKLKDHVVETLWENTEENDPFLKIFSSLKIPLLHAIETFNHSDDSNSNKVIEQRKSIIDYLNGLAVQSQKADPEVFTCLSGYLEKIIVYPQHFKFILLALNQTYSFPKDKMNEISNRSDDPISSRIQRLKEFIKSKEKVYYLALFKSFLTGLITSDQRNQESSKNIQHRLELIKNHTGSVLERSIKNYSQQLAEINIYSSLQRLEDLQGKNAQLVALENSINAEIPFKEVKKAILAHLSKFKLGVKSRFEEDHRCINDLNEIIASPEKIRLFKENYEKEKTAVLQCLEDHIKACEVLEDFDSLEKLGFIIPKINPLYSVRQETEEYRFALGVMSSNKAIASTTLRFFSGAIIQKDSLRGKLIEDLSTKLFFLLEQAKPEKFSALFESLLGFNVNQLVRVDEWDCSKEEYTHSVNSFNEFQAELIYFIRNKCLDKFIAEHPEKVCEYVIDKLERAESWQELKDSLSYLSIDQLNDLSQKNSDLDPTIQRIIATKKLLKLFEEAKNTPILQWRDALCLDIALLCQNFVLHNWRLPLLKADSHDGGFSSISIAMDSIRKHLDALKQKSDYNGTFFLKPDKEKKNLIKELTGNLKLWRADDNSLEAELASWEETHKSIIDKPRYRLFFAIIMIVYHAMKELVGGSPSETETRRIFNQLRQCASELPPAVEALNSPTRRAG